MLEPIAIGTFSVDLQDLLLMRTTNAQYLQTRLERNGLGKYLELPEQANDRIWTTYPLILKPEAVQYQTELMNHLRSQSIEHTCNWAGVIGVPVHQDLKLKDMNRIFQAIHQFFMERDPELRLRIMEYEI